MSNCDRQRYDALSASQREKHLFNAEFARALLKQRPFQPEALGMAANALTALGYYEDGLEYDERLAAIRPRDPLVIYNLACSLALTGAAEKALERLEEAVKLGYADAQYLKKDPDLANLREHPRFQQLVQLAKKNTVSAPDTAIHHS